MLNRCLSRLAAGLVLCLWAANPSLAGVVTLDAAANKATSDTSALEPKWLRKSGDRQYGVYVQSTVLEPQSFTFRITGLKEQSYDIYVNSAYIGEKSVGQLEQGIELSIPGRVADPGQIRCLESLKPKVDAEYARLQKIKESEPMRVSNTLMQAVDWVNSGIRNEAVYRSVDIVAAPAGKVLQKMVWSTRLDAAAAAKAVGRACWLLQNARDRMHECIKDPELRDTAIAALTPVDLSVEFSSRNGKPHVEAKLVNNCDLPVSGVLSCALPKEWKMNVKDLAFKELKSGQTFCVSFDLVPTVKSAPAPDKLPIAATMTITQDLLTAKFKLKTVAAMSKPAQ